MITSRNNDPRWILATIVKSRNRQFWGWHELFFMKFYWLHFSEYVLYCTWNQNFFFRFCAGKFSSAAPTIMDARSSLRWLSSSWQWHYYAIISDSTNEPPTIWAKYCGYKYNCLRLLACMPIASISMCSNTLYLFIGETRFRYCDYSCLWNFSLLRKSCKSSNVV
jgi:hypothetical protein